MSTRSKKTFRALAVTAALPIMFSGMGLTSAYADTCEACSNIVETQVMLGTLPAPTTVDANAIDTPNPTAMVAKEQALAAANEAVGSLLAAGATAAVPTDVSVTNATTESTPPDGSTPYPSAYALTVRGQKQQTDHWCVPTSTAIILATMGLTPPTQSALATEEHTTAQGTAMTYAVKPLNRRETRNHYILKTDTSSALDLLSASMTDTYRFRSSVMFAINVSAIGYFPPGYTGSHAETNYGYYTQGTGGVYLFDPEDGTMFGQSHSYYGKHTVDIKHAWAAVSGDGNQIIW